MTTPHYPPYQLPGVAKARRTDPKAVTCHTIDQACRLAHRRTVADCARLQIPVRCRGLMDCTDGGIDHDNPTARHYGALAGEVFAKHYSHILRVAGV